MSSGRTRVIHVSADFPDPVEPSKTSAIKALIDLTADDFVHEVVSLNRRSPGWLSLASETLRGLGRPKLKLEASSFGYGQALRYHAPTRGLLHATMLRQIGDWLADRIAAGPRPDLLVGHKLAVEGIAVRRAAERLGIPYALSIQGDTDLKILKARPDLAAEFRQAFHGAAVLFPFAPWSLQALQDRLGQRAGPVRMLPCVTSVGEPRAPSPDGAGFLSVFHLKNWRRKNFPRLVRAMKLLAEKGEGLPLAVIGGGSDDQLARCRKLAEGEPRIVFEGAFGHDRLFDRMNASTAFVLPSRRESFGMVFIEALFSGLPIIYPRGASVDGYFDGEDFAIPVDARDPADIARAMRYAAKEEASLKAKLRDWQQSEAAQAFTSGAIAGQFRTGLQEAASAGSKENPHGRAP